MTESAVVRYPDPGIKILDPRFSALVLGNAAIERNGRRKPAPSAFSAGPHITPTAIPATARVGW